MSGNVHRKDADSLPKAHEYDMLKAREQFYRRMKVMSTQSSRSDYPCCPTCLVLAVECVRGELIVMPNRTSSKIVHHEGGEQVGCPWTEW